MRSPNLQLTLTDEQFSLTPLPGATASPCTAGPQCQHLATHRLLSRTPAGVMLMCDEHTRQWAAEQRINVTTGTTYDSAA